MQLRIPPILAVVTLQGIEDLPPLADALHKGGVRAIELALRTPCALEAISQIRSRHPDILVAAGTTLNPQQLDEAHNAGAHFTLAPGVNIKTLDYAANTDRLHIPGVATPTDIQTSLRYDVRILKFFPAKPFGGLSTLATIHSPFAHLKLSYIPMGGITLDDIPSYAASSLVTSIGSSAIAPSALIREKNWAQIQSNAQTAVSAANPI